MPHPLYIPELLELVLGYCQRQDLARLSLASRYFLNATTSYLWEYVTCTPIEFLSLINGAIILDNGQFQTVVLPNKISHKSLGRLSIYSGFIKHLELETGPPSVHYVNNPQAFTAFARTGVFLPNLQSFSIEAYDYSDCELQWAVGLFSSTLLEIRCAPSAGTLPPLAFDETLYWLESITSRCPNIHTLELHPYKRWVEWDESIPDSVHEAADHTQSLFHKPLGRLRELRSVTVSVYLASRYDFIALSRLPKLERLEICTGHQLDAQIVDYELPHGSFPVLKHLALRNLQHEDLWSIWDMEPLTQHLTSLDLVLNPQPDPEEGPVEFAMLCNWIPSRVLAKFHQLTHLTIRIELLTHGKMNLLDEGELESLSPLPLEYVFIQGASVYEGFEGETPCELLANTWPNIRELHWPDQPATIKDLVHFMALPRLYHLTLNLRITPPPKNITPLENGSGVFRVLECSKPKPLHSTEESRKEVARFLCDGWPNLSLVWPNQARNPRSSMSLLCEAIKAEQELSRMK